jgi:glutamate synthase domain-containing protein 2
MERLKSNDVLSTVNRGNPAESGLCTLCRADCTGKCETWLSCMKGRDLLYPRDFGNITAGSGNACPVGVSYEALRINGYNYGAKSAPGSAATGDVLFTDVRLETSFGRRAPVKCRYPFITGALGSTAIAAKYWDSFAAGSALCGIPMVIGENVVGIDRAAEIRNGKIDKAPELDRRLASYRRYYDGYGAIVVQMNIEDTRNGVAAYVIEKFGDEVVLELKWGQGAKDIGGEISVTEQKYAEFLKGRGYLVDPDPESPGAREACAGGRTLNFARHSRLGYTNRQNYEEVRQDFMQSVAYLRTLGFKRITLKTGAYGMEALAMAVRLAADAELDLLSVDGAGGGTGMSPWDMMEHWGVPSLLLHTKAYEYARILAERGIKPADMAFAGGIAKSSAIFKALALGAPYAKLVCMGRAVMIPGFLGANIEGVLKPESRGKVFGNWDNLPKSVSDIGATAESIFAGYYAMQDKLGKTVMAEVPYGAIAMWTLLDKLGAGLQQFMAGARKFTPDAVSRDDIASCNRETERETGIAFITEQQDAAAKRILNG